MTNTPHLGMPFIEGSQAQKHVTHNESLRILDAAIQIGVLDNDRTAPPSAPAEGDRHIVASGATGAWAGQANAVAVREDGAWRFLAPKLGWCAWSDAEGVLLVYDGAAWIELAGGSMGDSLAQLGINGTASDPNLLTVRSNAALFNAVDVADGGTGDMRVQVSKEGSAHTASMVFSDAFSGRAEFGLVGSDAFKLKVSNDGSTFVEALVFDQATGNAAFQRGLSLTGVISPAQITSNQNDYAPTGFAAASTLRLSSDANRNVTGLAGGADGRVIVIHNIGSSDLVLKNENVLSAAANRFATGADVTVGANTSSTLRYDGTSSRWRTIAGAGSGGGGGGPGTVTSITVGNGLSGGVITTAGTIGLAFSIPPQGRLTLQTGVPVMTTTQSAKTTIIYTPYTGNLIPLYDGTNIVPTLFTELSVLTTDATKNPAAIGAGKVNDWFVWNDSGTLRLSHGPDWTNDTTRSAGTALVRVNGIWLNNASITNGPSASRGTYVGTTRSNASSQLDWIPGGSGSGGVAAFLNVWNAYNRVAVAATSIDTGSPYNYSSSTIRQARASSGNQINYVSGLAEDALLGISSSRVNTNGANQSVSLVGLGSGATNAFAAYSLVFSPAASVFVANATAQIVLPPSLGVNFLSRNEQGDNANANGLNNGAVDFISAQVRM